MSNNATTIETLFEKAENYGKTSVELFKLKAIGKSADIISSLATKIVLTVVVAIFAICINIGIALWAGELLGKFYYGFFAVAGFYAVLAILFFTFRHEWIKKPVCNAIIVQMQQKTT